MIELRHLTKEYPGSEQPAVDDLSLSIETKETVALLGPSGCGKTSTLNMIVGLEKPTSGDIVVDGRSILGIPAEKRGIGLVFQDYAVFTSMTVRGNLSFGLKIKKKDKREIERKVGEMADFLDLSDKLEVKASKLSGSELQRVAIGRTLVTEPSILLLDEPLSNLEPEARLSMRQELRRLRNEMGLTIIYVTHDQVEALSLADRLAIMSYGRLIEAEKTSVIVERPSHVQVAGFLGSPPMNVVGGHFLYRDGFIAFRHESADFRLPLLSLPDFVKIGGAHYYYLGVRPEDLKLTGEPSPFYQGVVTGLEHRGFDHVVTVAGKGPEMKALAPGAVPGWGEKAGLSTTADKLFLFDRRGILIEAGLS
jgi:multiple sugar transport system ATP-binding protein